MGISRRGFVTGPAGVGLSRIVAPNAARGAEGPIRIGLLTVAGEDGPLGFRRHRYGTRARAERSSW
jgi:hypothetical protein